MKKIKDMTEEEFDNADESELLESLFESTTKRHVYIKNMGDTYMVLYSDHKKFKHYSPAQFYKPDHTLEWVKNWIKNQPDLILDK